MVGDCGGNIMKKKFLFVIVLFSFFIPVKTFGLSGDISFSCNSTTVNVGDEVRCKITGTSDGSVSEVFSNLTSDGNIIVTNFKAERIWKINSEWPNLSLTSSDKYPGNFELGTVYLKAVASGVGTFYMNGITFTSDNGEVAVIPNKSFAITVIGNTPDPTPIPDPTPVEPVKSSDATLKSLIVNDIDINFNPSINEYNVEVSSNVSSVKIDAVANDNKATIKLPTNLSLKEIKFFELPQNMQFGSYFFRIIDEPSTYISKGSFSAISNLFLISLGITILPNSSTFLTIPVDFMKNTPFRKSTFFMINRRQMQKRERVFLQTPCVFIYFSNIHQN